MRKNVIAIAIGLMLLANIVSASAAISNPIYRYEPLGHYYQVVLDGKGQAAVLAKIVQLNLGKENATNITLEIPGQVNIRYIFQEVSQPNIQPYYYYQTKFIDLDFKEEQLSTSKKITVELAEPISQGDSINLLIYYKAFGYVEKNINYNFDFETIKSPYDTPYLRVAVSVDEDLSLRGGGTKTHYIQNFGSFDKLAAIKSVAVSGNGANFIQGLSDSVQYADGYVKTKTNLGPWESFHVTGRYNEKDLWFLNYYEYIAGFLTAIIVLNVIIKGGLFRGVSEIIKKLRKSAISRVAFTGFLSAASVALIIAVIVFIGNFFYLGGTLSGILFMVAGASAILFSIAFTAYYHAQKYSNKEGLTVIISTIIWLVVFAFVISLLFSNPYYSVMNYAAQTVSSTLKTG